MAGVTSVVIDGTTYLLDDIYAVDFSEDQGLSEQQQQQGRSNIGAASGADMTAAQDDIDDLQTGAELLGINALLLHGEIPNKRRRLHLTRPPAMYRPSPTRAGIRLSARMRSLLPMAALPKCGR